MYAFLDVETTGINARNEKITEIAIYIHDGEKIVDEFISLVNPEKEIPYRIINLTGINDKMVEDAPRFCEIAKKIIEITEDRILVGHNVAFDYNFIRSEFRRLFYDYRRKTICTAKLSCKLLPMRASYSLGACKQFEPAEYYNKRVLEAIEPLRVDHSNMFIIDKGRSDDEKSVVLIKDSCYKSYGYIWAEYIYNREELEKCIVVKQDNRDVQQIIRSHLKYKEVEKVLMY